MSWQTRERLGPTLILEEKRESLGSLLDCSRQEKSKSKHITQGLYRMKLAFYDAKALEITTWWVSHI